MTEIAPAASGLGIIKHESENVTHFGYSLSTAGASLRDNNYIGKHFVCVA